MSSADPNRILVVDDEPNIVDVITMALRFQGFTTEAAPSCLPDGGLLVLDDGTHHLIP